MRLRTAVVLAMWALVIWGMFQAVGGLANHAYTKDVFCPGVNLGPDGEEHPSPMEPGDRCYPGLDSNETRTFDEQRAAQRAERGDVVIGSCAFGVGVLGLGALFVQSTLPERSPRHRWGVRGRRLRGRV